MLISGSFVRLSSFPRLNKNLPWAPRSPSGESFIIRKQWPRQMAGPRARVFLLSDSSAWGSQPRRCPLQPMSLDLSWSPKLDFLWLKFSPWFDFLGILPTPVFPGLKPWGASVFSSIKWRWLPSIIRWRKAVWRIKRDNGRRKCFTNPIN